jgi:AcrR family transcriptional regulator
MGTVERRERERQETRTKILDAARVLFAEQGYEAVTMRKVAERVEYSPTAIYFHFKDKEALMRELCELDFAALSQQFRKIAREEDPIERLRKIGHAYAAFGLEFPNHYRLMFMTPRPPIAHSEADEAKRGNPEEDAYAFLKATVQEGLAAGRFRPELKNADLLSQTVWAGTHGAISLHMAKRNDGWVDWHPVKKIAGVIIDALIRGLARESATEGKHPAEGNAGRRPAVT